MADCTVVNGQVFVNDRLFVPEEGDARLQVLHRNHNGAPAGHPGRFKTYDLLRRTYYWPRMSRDAEKFLNATAVEERIRRVVDHASSFMAEAQQRYADAADAHRQDSPTYLVGDRVWINTRNIKSGRPSEKLADKWMGPYKVTKVYPRAVAVELPADMQIFPVFHVALVKPTSEPYPGQAAANEEFDAWAEGAVITNPDRVDGEEEEREWVFEKILNSRVTS